MTPEQARDVLHARFDGLPWYRRAVVGRIDNDPVLFLIVAEPADCHREGVSYRVGGYPVLVRVDPPAQAAGQHYGSTR